MKKSIIFILVAMFCIMSSAAAAITVFIWRDELWKKNAPEPTFYPPYSSASPPSASPPSASPPSASPPSASPPSASPPSASPPSASPPSASPPSASPSVKFIEKDGVVSSEESWSPIPGTSYRRAKLSKGVVDAVVDASNELRKNADDLGAQGWKFHSEYGPTRTPYAWDDALADLAAKNGIESCNLQHPSLQPHRYHCINRNGDWKGDRACMAGGNENICFPITENRANETVGDVMMSCVHGMGFKERDTFLQYATKEQTAPVVEGKDVGHWATIVNPSWTKMGAAWIDCGNKPGQQGISHDQLVWIYAPQK